MTNTNTAPQPIPFTAPGVVPVIDPPPDAVLARFGLDLTTLAGLNETARRAEDLLDLWFRDQQAAKVANPAYRLDIKTIDIAAKILWHLTSVRKTLALLARLPAAAPDPVREKKRMAKVLGDAIDNMKKNGMLAPPRPQRPACSARPATPGAIRKPPVAPAAKTPEEQLTPPVPHPPMPLPLPPPPLPYNFATPPATTPAPPRLCPTLDLSNYSTPQSAFAWSFRALLQTEALLHRTAKSASNSASKSVSQSPSQSVSESESAIKNPQSAICNPKSDPILPILVNSPFPSPASPPADDS